MSSQGVDQTRTGVRSLLLAAWSGAYAEGSASREELLAGVLGEDPRHLVVGLDDEPVDLVDALDLVVRPGVAGARLALPVGGDPVGLAGPTELNLAALDSGEAVVFPGARPGIDALGLVPALDARVVVWQAYPAATPVPLDPQEHAATLRRTVSITWARLATLDLASWSPEVADLLTDLRSRPALHLPREFAVAHHDVVDRALLCLDLIELAEQAGGPLPAGQEEQRRTLLAELGRAARRALVSTCGQAPGPAPRLG